MGEREREMGERDRESAIQYEAQQSVCIHIQQGIVVIMKVKEKRWSRADLAQVCEGSSLHVEREVGVVCLLDTQQHAEPFDQFTHLRRYVGL